MLYIKQHMKRKKRKNESKTLKLILQGDNFQIQENINKNTLILKHKDETF